MDTILVTGAAGFIGYHTTRALLSAGYRVVGVDNINEYYDVNLKLARLSKLRHFELNGQFKFNKLDLTDAEELSKIFTKNEFKCVINLAAQAGVRYSLTNPRAYIDSNLIGFMNILENCRHTSCPNLIYASSSSVYGLNDELPFSETDRTDHPISLYAATKKSNEIMAHSYSHLFRLPTTGLRFFTVYGPWGRPDMAMFIFAEAILAGQPIRLFNGGKMQRDFTFVDDVVESIVRLVTSPAAPNPNWNKDNKESCSSSAPFRIFNIGNHSPVQVFDLISLMERKLNKKAIIKCEPIQPGDVLATYADVEKLKNAVQFQPKTTLEFGVGKFLEWFTEYKNECKID